LGGLQSWAECYREKRESPLLPGNTPQFLAYPAPYLDTKLLYLLQTSSTQVITAEYCIFIMYGFVSDDHCPKHKEVI
jgi:hypothetical protein